MILVRLYPAVLSKAANSALVRSRPPVITIMFRSRSLLKQWASSSGTTTSTSNNFPFRSRSGGFAVPLVVGPVSSLTRQPPASGYEHVPTAVNNSKMDRVRGVYLQLLPKS
jgi:hypothetical protein